MLAGDDMLSQVKKVEQILNIETSEQINDTLTNEDLKTAARLFIHLNFCPNLWFKFWYSFYTELFQTQSTDQIILTLNRMTKLKGKGTQVKDGNMRAAKLLKRIASKISLRYKDIQRLTKKEQLNNIKEEHQNLNISDNGNNPNHIIVCEAHL